MFPGDELESLCVYLTQSPIRDSAEHATLKAKALKLLAHAGATALPEVKPHPTVIIVLRVPVATSTVPQLKEAQEAGVPLTTLEWLEACVEKKQLLSLDDYPAPRWQPNLSSDPASSMDGLSMSQSLSQAMVTSRIFHGCRISLGALWLRDDSVCSEVERQLVSGRAKILPHDHSGRVTSGVPTHMVCAPFVQSRESVLLDTVRNTNKRLSAVTPFWIDSCIAAEQLLPVSMCVLFSPLLHEMPLRDMKERRVSITLSGFLRKGEDMWNRRREVLSRLAELLGAKYSDRMRRRGTTHVVADTRTPNSDKINKARDWGIKVVTHDWLLSCAAAGKLVAEEIYNVEPGMNGEAGESSSAVPSRNIVDLDEDEDEVTQTVVKRKDSSGTQPTPRRSGRHMTQGGSSVTGTPGPKEKSPDTAAINLFKRLTAGLEERTEKTASGSVEEVALTGGDDTDHVEDDGLRGRRSRSDSRDALGTDREWSMQPSQSQLIVHRDLTPPHDSQSKLKSMPSRAAKRPRTSE